MLNLLIYILKFFDIKNLSYSLHLINFFLNLNFYIKFKNLQTLATSCFLLAGKVTNDPVISVRDVMNISYWFVLFLI